MEPIQVIHDLVHRVHEDGVFAPAFDVLGKKFMRVTNFGLNACLNYFDVAFNLLLVYAIQIFANIVFITQLNDTVISFHILFGFHNEFFGCEVLKNGVTVNLNLLLTIFEGKLAWELFFKIHFLFLMTRTNYNAYIF